MLANFWNLRNQRPVVKINLIPKPERGGHTCIYTDVFVDLSS